MVQDHRRLSVRELFPSVIQWLAPAECSLCRGTDNDKGFLCADCQRTLPRSEHACQSGTNVRAAEKACEAASPESAQVWALARTPATTPQGKIVLSLRGAA